jgi:hypothetical protein
LFGRGGAQCDEQVGLAGAGVAEQNQRLAGVDPGAAGQVGQGRRRQVGQPGGVEVGESFGARELGLVDPADPAAGVAFIAFGGEHLGQKCLVGQALFGRGFGDADGLVADRGQGKGSAGGVDRGLGRGVGHGGERGCGGAGGGGTHAVASRRAWLSSWS